MRGLFAWAHGRGYVLSNPAANVAYPLLKSGDGFPMWTDDDVAAYERHYPLGTRERAVRVVVMPCDLDRSTSATAN
jgi:hypothetical protein